VTQFERPAPSDFDTTRMEAFVGQVLADQGAAISGLLIRIGDELGLYRAMAETGPVSSHDLADRTGTAERYVREWLNNQAASGYVEYDPATGEYTLPGEHAAVLAHDGHPAFMVGGFQSIAALYGAEARLLDAFRSGDGVGWHEHDPSLFRGTERFFKPGYLANLVPSWLPALEGVVESLEEGIVVADVGCGHGASTITMAQAFPRSTFVGFDYHAGSIEAARERAREAGVADRVRFEAAGAKEYPGTGYGLITFFDCLHDMGDPVGAATHARKALDPDGTMMLVEPMAGDRVEDNLNPVGRVYYGFSTVCCTPASLAQEVGLGLGAQAGEARLREVCERAGFSRFRRATETPVNLVLEARP
jgi:SAM-dependent methyltransferase